MTRGSLFIISGKPRLHFHRLGQRIIEALLRRGNQLGNGVGFCERQAERAADVPDRRLGFERPERRDLRHPVGAVLVFDVLNDLRPSANTKIDVDIRHRTALGIEEPLEQQDMADRIEIGDFERIGDQAAGRRTASRPDRDTALLGIVDKIRDHQKIAGKLHALDHIELVFEPLVITFSAFPDR